MEPSGLLSSAIGLFGKAAEKLYDRLEASRAVKVVVQPGFAGLGRQAVAVVIVSTFNRGPRPQRVDGVALLLSHKAGILLVMSPRIQTSPIPHIITETDPHQFFFEANDVLRALKEKRVDLKNAKIQVVGAVVHLANGRSVRTHQRIDVDALVRGS